MDLRNKAQWHKDVNGGFIPVLETPQGDLIPESAVIADFAADYAHSKGSPLYPAEGGADNVSASVLTAKHRLLMQKFT